MTPGRCHACAAELPGSARFCLACGAPVSSAAVPAGAAVVDPGSVAATRAGAASAWRSTSSDSGSGRFVAGHILAGRYRITGLLGRGGMGEVYRADDLKLGQPVALKFLPPELQADPGRLARFHNEVRLARQVSHPNVCRVYDIGEADGQPFLTMEFVDGEDLASLLRRIGRFPADKGVDVARQICAGLAAAHDRGVLHRDLKPANIMIDGRGRARITDFGLAEAEGGVAADDLRAGTPLYMAPEQIEGREVTVRSDLYALGLVLYELFTGRPAFPTESHAAWLRARRESTPATPGSVTPGLDPAIERTILRCLERDPSSRPASALAVSASLPGGDPLAAALAAGETPSPEMVAAAGTEGGLSPAAAWGALLAVAVALVINIVMSRSTYLVNVAGLDLPAQVLVQKAREAALALGHDAPAGDTAFGFERHDALMEWVQKSDLSPDRWRKLESGRPPAVLFWYRQSPGPMASERTFSNISPQSPPSTVPGMATIWLDPRGRLLRFDAVPDEAMHAAASDSRAAIAQDRLFGLAGLDPSRFRPAVPERIPPQYCDDRRAWEGTTSERPEMPLLVESCSLQGRVVHFAIHGPWDLPATSSRAAPGNTPLRDQIQQAIFIVALAGAMLMARRNLALGRGDRRGALTIALYFTVMHLVVWALWISHVPSLQEEWRIFSQDTGWTLFNAVAIWIFYVALEPYVRRLWPATLISWTRLLSGRLADPRVGRDILIGLGVGFVCNLFRLIGLQIARLIGMNPARPEWGESGNLLPVFGMAQIVDTHVHAILIAMQMLSLLLLLRILLRRIEPAAVVFVLLITVQLSAGSEMPRIQVPLTLVAVSLYTFAVVRFGLLTSIAAMFAVNAMGVPLTPDLTSWRSGATWAAIIAIGGLTIWAFRTSLARQPMFGWLAAGE